jgi:hypothetical protein
VTGEESFERLVSIASPALGDAPTGHAIGAGEREAELSELLTLRNGFFAFESALRVFPSGSAVAGRSLEEWNAGPAWRDAYGGSADGALFFAEDAFGGQFAIKDGTIARFDPETAEYEQMAEDLAGWCRAILDDFEFQTGYPLIAEWQRTHGPIGLEERLLPKTPFVLGGEYVIDNLVALDAAEGMRLRGELARQLEDLPEGAHVVYRVTGATE